MKYQLRYKMFALPLMALILTSRAFSADIPATEVPVDSLLVPSYGFEEKNNIQAVLYGVLPNSCYSLGEQQVAKDLQNHVVLIRQFANKATSGICANEENLPPHMSMTIPFVVEVSLGQLEKGDYTFLYRKPEGLLGSRKVSVSSNISPSTDTLPYAAVLNTMVSSIHSSKKDIEVTISGVLNSSCISLEDEVHVLKEGDVFVLLPTVKVNPNVVCAQVLIPFEKKVNLGKVNPGRYLVHTRSMNGQAINRVFEVNP